MSVEARGDGDVGPVFERKSERSVSSPTEREPERSTPWPRVRRVLEGIYEAKDGARRVMPLEGVRGLAVTLVFLFHFHEAFGLYLPAESSVLMLSAYAARLGYYGVDLFFTLSGFLIYGALMRSRRSYLGFIGRRIQRIYPTFVVVFCIYLVLSAVFPERSRLPSEGRWTYVLQNLLLLPGVWGIKPVVGVAWSLSYEMVFYVTLPLVMVGLTFRAWWPGARIALTLAVALVVLVTGPPDSALGQFLMFVPGIILYEVLYSLRSPLWLSLRGERIALGAFLATFPAAILLESMRVPLDVASALPCWRAVLRMLVVGGGFLLMLLYAVAGSGPVGRLFCWTPLRWLGNVSYSYYLIHGLALNGVAIVVLGLAPPSSPRVPLFLLLLPVAYALTIVMATGLFVLIERPLSMRTGNR